MGSISGPVEITQIGVIGTGVMGSMLSLLFAEHANIDVSIYDRSKESMQHTVAKAKAAGLSHRIHACDDFATLVDSLPSRKVFLFSLPHGGPGDAVVSTLEPYLRPGDIVIDGSNEDFLVTQRRQALLQPIGVAYVGMGVSGGFSGARNGPSLMPSGDEWALDALMPLLAQIAAKDELGVPCVTKVGPGGSGHYVKMVHNGIEHGVMSALCETWGIMHSCLGMNGDEIGDVFDSWNESGELRANFLVAISGPICRTRTELDSDSYLLPTINDAVVQDANNSEGTGTWANLNAVFEHVPAPTLTSAHYLRIASANIPLRRTITQTFSTSAPQPLDLTTHATTKASVLNDLHSAVYAATLSAFIQGLDLLTTKSRTESWSLSLPEILRVWRAGCIIKSDAITDLFSQHYTSTSTSTCTSTSAQIHPLSNPLLANPLTRALPALKRTTLLALHADAHVPSLAATLEYLKAAGAAPGTLPTRFSEAQLDSFGAHGFDLRADEESVKPMAKGRRHCGWGMS